MSVVSTCAGHVFQQTYRVWVKPLAMYVSMPESNDAVSVTDDRKGNSPTSELSVDMEEALKDGHATDLASDMQLCAIAVGRLLASNAHNAVDGLLWCVFRRFDRRCDRCRLVYNVRPCCGEARKPSDLIWCPALSYASILS